jgi:starch-binding outer membrane protein, SusD/RagB family
MTLGSRTALLLSAVALSACSADRLNVPNYNAPTPEGAASAPLVALQQASAGLLTQVRALWGTGNGPVSQFAYFGREAFNYTAQEGRNTTGYLVNPTDNVSFGVGTFAGYYTLRRNAQNFYKIVDLAAPFLPADSVAAARGFAKTLEGWDMLLYIMSRHNLGGAVEQTEDPNFIAPFVSRDSVYSWSVNRLNEGLTDLQAGKSFPFALTAGFAGFNTPATFAKFNRAVAARALAYRGSLATGAARTQFYQQALAALGGSFVSTSDGVNVGVYQVYSTASGEAINGMNATSNLDFVAHPSIVTDAEAGDRRLATKTKTIARKNPPVPNAISTTVGFALYPAQTTPVPIIKNAELVLLRAEARYFTGDKAGALTDLNYVRTTDGGLAALGAGDIDTDDKFITRLLYERRYSLFVEGHRWVDVRRFGRLTSLPLDHPTHMRAEQQVLPVQECDSRTNTGDPALKGPSCP